MPQASPCGLVIAYTLAEEYDTVDDEVEDGYSWDKDKSDAVFRERGFDFEVASAIFLDSQYIEHEDVREDYGEPRFVSTGIVADVGIIAVVWTPRERRRHIITAWRASKSEKEEYYANYAGFQGADPPP